jgi:hypothetical protein
MTKKNKVIVNNSIGIQIIFLLSGSFIFAYCFGIIIHELGHVLAYLYYGVSTNVFVIHPFGRNYMEPMVDITHGKFLIGASGTLFNVFCAISFSFLFIRTKNLFLMPFLIWGATSLIQESIAIILDITKGSQYDWSKVISSGIPLWIVISLSIFFLVIGSLYFLRLMAFAGLKKSDSYIKILSVCLGSVIPFFLFALIYSIMYQKTMIFSKTVPLISSIILSLLLSITFKPTFNYLGKILPNKKAITIEFQHIVFSISLALIIILFGLLYFN